MHLIAEKVERRSASEGPLEEEMHASKLLKLSNLCDYVRWGTLKVWDNPKQTEGDGGEPLGCPTS